MEKARKNPDWLPGTFHYIEGVASVSLIGSLFTKAISLPFLFLNIFPPLLRASFSFFTTAFSVISSRCATSSRLLHSPSIRPILEVITLNSFLLRFHFSILRNPSITSCFRPPSSSRFLNSSSVAILRNLSILLYVTKQDSFGLTTWFETNLRYSIILKLDLYFRKPVSTSTSSNTFITSSNKLYSLLNNLIVAPPICISNPFLVILLLILKSSYTSHYSINFIFCQEYSLKLR